MRKIALALSLAVSVAGVAASAGSETQDAVAGGTTPLTIMVDEAQPGTQVGLSLNAGADHASTTGTVASDGTLSMVMGLANLGKAAVVEETWIGDRCVDGRTRIELTEAGVPPASIPPECRRRMAGAFLLHKDHVVIVHLRRGTVTVSRAKMSTKTKTLVGGGIVAGAATAIGVAGRSSSDTTPAATSTSTSTPTTTPTTPTTPATPGPGGTYTIRLTIVSDPAGHDPFTRYSTVTTITVTINGSSVTITGPSPWVTVVGSFNSTTGAFNASGTGTVAGFNNVPVSATGTMSGNSITISQLQAGPTNLPTNQAEILSGSGTKP